MISKKHLPSKDKLKQKYSALLENSEIAKIRHWSMPHGEQKKKFLSLEEAQVLVKLSKSSLMTGKDLSILLDIPQVEVDSAISNLFSQGYIDRLGENILYFFVPEFRNKTYRSSPPKPEEYLSVTRKGFFAVNPIVKVHSEVLDDISPRFEISNKGIERDYAIAESFTEIFLDLPQEQHEEISSALEKMPFSFRRIFLSALNDAEFQTTNQSLIDYIILLAHSNDKAMAQTAAIFLIGSTGKEGEEAVQSIILEGRAPHANLVSGMSELMGGESAQH